MPLFRTEPYDWRPRHAHTPEVIGVKVCSVMRCDTPRLPPFIVWLLGPIPHTHTTMFIGAENDPMLQRLVDSDPDRMSIVPLLYTTPTALAAVVTKAYQQHRPVLLPPMFN